MSSEERIAAILSDPEVQWIGALIQEEESRAGRELHQPSTARDQRSWMTPSFCSNSASRIRLVKAPGIVSERPRIRTARKSHQNPPRIWCCRLSIRVTSLHKIERRLMNVRNSIPLAVRSVRP